MRALGFEPKKEEIQKMISDVDVPRPAAERCVQAMCVVRKWAKCLRKCEWLVTDLRGWLLVYNFWYVLVTGVPSKARLEREDVEKGPCLELGLKKTGWSGLGCLLEDDGSGTIGYEAQAEQN